MGNILLPFHDIEKITSEMNSAGLITPINIYYNHIWAKKFFSTEFSKRHIEPRKIRNSSKLQSEESLVLDLSFQAEKSKFYSNQKKCAPPPQKNAKNGLFCKNAPYKIGHKSRQGSRIEKIFTFLSRAWIGLSIEMLHNFCKFLWKMSIFEPAPFRPSRKFFRKIFKIVMSAFL